MTEDEEFEVMFDANVSLHFHYGANLFDLIGYILNNADVENPKSVTSVLEHALCVAAAGEAMMCGMVRECDERNEAQSKNSASRLQ